MDNDKVIIKAKASNYKRTENGIDLIEIRFTKISIRVIAEIGKLLRIKIRKLGVKRKNEGGNDRKRFDIS